MSFLRLSTGIFTSLRGERRKASKEVKHATRQ